MHLNVRVSKTRTFITIVTRNNIKVIVKKLHEFFPEKRYGVIEGVLHNALESGKEELNLNP